jgi:hypothetical protein
VLGLSGTENAWTATCGTRDTFVSQSGRKSSEIQGKSARADGALTRRSCRPNWLCLTHADGALRPVRIQDGCAGPVAREGLAVASQTITPPRTGTLAPGSAATAPSPTFIVGRSARASATLRHVIGASATPVTRRESDQTTYRRSSPGFFSRRRAGGPRAPPLRSRSPSLAGAARQADRQCRGIRRLGPARREIRIDPSAASDRRGTPVRRAHAHRPILPVPAATAGRGRDRGCFSRFDLRVAVVCEGEHAGGPGAPAHTIRPSFPTARCP